MIYEMLSGINPFKVRNKNKFEKLQMILEDEIEMQPAFSDDACSLIQGLLSKKPKQRLGYNGCHEIKEHPFFVGINWLALGKREVEPPFRPRINGDLDLGNIDRVSREFLNHCSNSYLPGSQLRRRPKRAINRYLRV